MIHIVSNQMTFANKYDILITTSKKVVAILLGCSCKRTEALKGEIIMNFTSEQIQKAKQAKTAEELLLLAKDNGYEITEEEANKYLYDAKVVKKISEDSSSLFLKALLNKVC